MKKDSLIAIFLLSVLVFSDWEDEVIVKLAKKVSADFVDPEKMPWLACLRFSWEENPLEAVYFARLDARKENIDEYNDGDVDTSADGDHGGDGDDAGADHD